ncbi:8984_t:CDS:2 [Acaulospora morrowiae]|uniref:8984_t:CDS:1 n=1 Tax=Acaulospora morrowiae TaxID=94023 RepID=A0A9N9HLT3_9GLOM|nr:8984_t:CDS:2 [Acaulospora morrowiae]
MLLVTNSDNNVSYFPLLDQSMTKSKKCGVSTLFYEKNSVKGYGVVLVRNEGATSGYRVAVV